MHNIDKVLHVYSLLFSRLPTFSKPNLTSKISRQGCGSQYKYAYIQHALIYGEYNYKLAVLSEENMCTVMNNILAAFSYALNKCVQNMTKRKYTKLYIKYEIKNTLFLPCAFRQPLNLECLIILDNISSLG